MEKRHRHSLVHYVIVSESQKLTFRCNKKFFEHLVAYATIPPHLPKTFENSDGMRFWKAQVLKLLGKKYKNDNWTRASLMFENSGRLIIELCKAAVKKERRSASEIILKIAEMEETAYKLIHG